MFLLWKMPLKIFLDFDGTITRKDVGVMLLDRFGDPHWRDFDEQFEKGEITMRECLNNEWKGFKGTYKQVTTEILPLVEIESGFTDFVQRMTEIRIPLVILSDGFVGYIKQIFESKNIATDTFELYANHANFNPDGKVFIEYITDECEHGCANCKTSFVKKAKKEGYKTIYIGDGLSDFYPAQIADYVFAKSGKSLERFCVENQIKFYSFKDFYEVMEKLVQISTRQCRTCRF